MPVRLSELLRSRVVSSDGYTVGRVIDVRVVQDGPLLEGLVAAPRVELLAVGRAALGLRLGYHPESARPPWLLRVLFAALARGVVYVRWDDVVSWEPQDRRIRAGATRRALRESSP